MGSKSLRQSLYLVLQGCKSLLQLSDAHWLGLNRCLQRLLGGHHMLAWHGPSQQNDDLHAKRGGGKVGGKPGRGSGTEAALRGHGDDTGHSLAWEDRREDAKLCSEARLEWVGATRTWAGAARPALGGVPRHLGYVPPHLHSEVVPKGDVGHALGGLQHQDKVLCGRWEGGERHSKQVDAQKAEQRMPFHCVLARGTVEILNRALQAKRASNWCFGCEAA
ncbi:MAG: hypothetical protein FRX49_02649 [Trebouxia sp. A1-2]|nr:MAG: hypothetical protein FRX49_02649 [Trebouxia sp. A1-2]